MAPIQVSIKHGGKTYSNLQLDPDLPGLAFKQTVYEQTGVPPDRVKIMVKGGVLKDESDWNKLGIKPGQVFTVVGAAGELPQPPPKPIVFLEDMDDQEMADALRVPVGLQNLGNTCYMNSTVQALRAIPELQTALQSYTETPSDPSGRLTASMRDLYGQMSKQTDGFPPLAFIQNLRQVAPQFAEIVRGGYAQQDAEECWVQIMNSLGAVLPGSSGSNKRFVEQYMTGEMTKELKCEEAPEEPATTTKEKILKIDCNISVNTNYMHTGIKDALDGQVEKNSASLGRTAVYHEKSRLSRIPSNLTVHMVRFYWRRDINKKAKIMRKVKFPFELDVLDIVTDELKTKLVPVNAKLKEIDRDRQERRKVRRRTKTKAAELAAEALTAAKGAVVSGVSAIASGVSSVATAVGGGVTQPEGGAAADDKKEKDGDVAMANGEEKKKKVEDGELEHESVYRVKEKAELDALINVDLKADIGSNVSGLYELCAIVTHKGASADSGHYMGFVKRDSFGPLTGVNDDEGLDADTEEWVKFDDDKVSIITREKILTLEGGGEDSSAYILLYRSKKLE